MPQTRSSVVASDSGTTDDPLIAAARVLVERGAIGGFWLSHDLVIEHVIGTHLVRAEPGGFVTDALAALIGLEDEIAKLRHEGAGTRVLRIPNTAAIAPDGSQGRRVNASISWVELRGQYLVMLSAVMREHSPTIELDQEIRRRRLVEQELAAQLPEIKRIKEQLEEFTYIISHDLNAPLRGLRYLCNDIERAIADADAAGGPADRAQLSKATTGIVAQTKRMSRMLMDLLEYARVGRTKEQIALVDTAAIAQSIVATLAPTTTLALDIVGDWPTLETAGAPLDVVLRNLAENAVKHHDQPDGRVTLRATPGDRFIEFRIEDDGRGIPEEWQEAIFQPFRKVDDAHHPESSGIGLALVKQTIVTFGGTISVESTPPAARGTTFIVRWPRRLVISDETDSQ